jgi:FtsP/CotA-like multicopper oxidase with cupredoxin domain
VKVFIEFRDFTGLTVFHCHNLEHEDMFMMARLDIVQ